MAINYFLATISSIEYDYFLLLDPDIIQIKPNAISSIVTKMEITNASVYSFPWHLKWYSKACSRTTPISCYLVEKYCRVGFLIFLLRSIIVHGLSSFFVH